MNGTPGSPDHRALTADEVVQRIERLVGHLSGRAVAVAFSAGADSTALLYLLAEAALGRGFTLRALHVDHGLHSDSGRWALHCQTLCERIGCPVRIVPVSVRDSGAGSVEAAAREARYAAFEEALDPGEILLTAQHREDQAETVLHGLLRGSGRAGLRGMSAVRSFARGTLARPLLDVPRARLAATCAERRVSYIEDPTNADPRLARGYLRTRVWPVLEARWPAVAVTLSRAGELAAEEHGLLEQLAEEDLARCDPSPAEPYALARSRIDARKLAALGEARARNALRHWFRNHGVRPPARARLIHIVAALLRGTPSGTESWDGATLYRYRDALYVASRVRNDRQAAGAIAPREWDLREPLDLEEVSLRLVPVAATGSGLCRSLGVEGVSVRGRIGGERVRLPGAAHRKDLRKLYQELGVPPWARMRLPVLWAAGRPVCVPAVSVFEGAVAAPAQAGIEIHVIDLATPPGNRVRSPRDGAP